MQFKNKKSYLAEHLLLRAKPLTKMSYLNILHLSDLHIGKFRYPNPQTLSVKISQVLEDYSKKVDVVIVSGDIFDGRGNEEHFEKDIKDAITLFDTLIVQLINKELVESTFSKEDILFVPGNHDLVRKEGQEYDKYNLFVKSYYPKGRLTKLVNFSDNYSFYYKHPSKKVIILGFNSCQIKKEEIEEKDLKIINQVNLTGLPDEDEIRKRFQDAFRKQEKWDDFGDIDTIEMENLFTKFRKEVLNISEYTIVATFHHHFYPFPEIVDKYGDTSWIRNYAEVVDNFQRHKVNLVLHGHKHLAIQRAITDNKYFDNPDSIIYVLAAGSIGYSGVQTPSFQWVRVHDKETLKIADVERYEFKEQQLDKAISFLLPPQKKENKSVEIKLLEFLQTEDSELYKKYIHITNEFEQVYQDNNIEKIINVIGGLITIFPDINLHLQKNSKLVYTILLSINYRTIYLRNFHTPESQSKLLPLLNRLEKAIQEVLTDNNYQKNLIAFLNSVSNKEISTNYEKIIKGVSTSDKKYTAYLSLAVFFTDLFLNVSQYGEYYFEKEGIKHKITINLKKNIFYDSIPTNTINIEGNIDRRAIILDFKCTDPTVHKVAVLIVKDFEMRLNKFEESLKEINLKLYYILPKVTPFKYDLDNFHFDAYIPTLLPLLTGENLYKQREVFIRELVQNSIDAILLREKLQPNISFDKTIRIELGKETKDNKTRKYFKIVDEGIGMSKFTIERYFTSIGRSFYVSEEFEELQKDKQIKYQAISNFGIGFLSSFMVCEEILVKTRSMLDESEGLEIEIPNYEGCFFIRNISKSNIGTEIILYEDNRNYFEFKRYIDYIRYTFLNIPLPLKVINKTANKSFTIDNYAFHKKAILQNLRNEKKPIFFVPFDEVGIGNLSWEDLTIKPVDELPKYGIYLDFDIYSTLNYGFHYNYSFNYNLNNGLRISEGNSPLKTDNIGLLQITNFPSSFIQLDVAREKISNFKIPIPEENIVNSLKQQVKGYLTDINFKNIATPYNINKLIKNCKSGLENNGFDFSEYSFCLKIEKEHNNYFLLTIVPLAKISNDNQFNEVAYINTNNINSINHLLETINLWNKQIKIEKNRELRGLLEMSEILHSNYLLSLKEIMSRNKKNRAIEIMELFENGELMEKNKLEINETIVSSDVLEIIESKKLVKSRNYQNQLEREINYLFNLFLSERAHQTRTYSPTSFIISFYVIYMKFLSSILVKDISNTNIRIYLNNLD